MANKCYFSTSFGSQLRRNDVSKNEEHSVEPPNTQKYRLAATGAGMIVCQERSRHTFRALLAMRARVVGVGYGITGGGFVEQADIFSKPFGFVRLTAEEAWRETVEENPGFESIISLEDFLERAQSISSLHVRVNDDCGIHGANYYALTVTDEEWDLIAVLPASAERDGQLIEVYVDFTNKVLHRHDSEKHITLMLPDGRAACGGFYHKHEMHSLGQIAWHIQQGFLWKPQ
jgi:hypothetical protein